MFEKLLMQYFKFFCWFDFWNGKKTFLMEFNLFQQAAKNISSDFQTKYCSFYRNFQKMFACSTRPFYVNKNKHSQWARGISYLWTTKLS